MAMDGMLLLEELVLMVEVLVPPLPSSVLTTSMSRSASCGRGREKGGRVRGGDPEGVAVC